MVRKELVFVGLSGGVDSSVAALRLIRNGFDVVGVFIKVWQPDFVQCDFERERLDAMRVAAHLRIPFLTFDAESVYKKEVADYMIREYARGNTPNPDVMCNRSVKFGAFLDFALASGATKIATGHYARVVQEQSEPALMRGVDTDKDQSYFLWTLTRDQLSRTLFPIGDTSKTDIRKEAEHAGLSTFKKKDSQGICFLGQIDMKVFLKHYYDEQPGDLIDTEGIIIGRHAGALFYTLGERHGFTITNRGETGTPLFVVGKNIEKNTITVAESPQQLRDEHIVLSDMQVRGIGAGESCEAQFRYRQTPFHVTFTELAGDHGKLVVTDSSIETPSRGQSCVLYEGALCLGGGIIS